MTQQQPGWAIPVNMVARPSHRSVRYRLALDRIEPVRLALPGEAPRDVLLTTRPVGSLGWQLVQLGDPGEAHSIALGSALATSFACAFLLGLAAHVRHRQRRREELRRIHGQLEQRIAERTVDLTEKIRCAGTDRSDSARNPEQCRTGRQTGGAGPDVGRYHA